MPLQNLGGRVNYAVFVSRNSQAIHNGSDSEISEMTMVLHGGREPNRPAA